jgi:dsDNA-binding SOS-regulon protein
VRGMAPQAKEKIEVVHRACQQISPIYPDYATRPVQDGFSWYSSLAGCPFERLYLVVFRSVRRPSADLALLSEHDDRAYEKALESGGLLRYFKGEANEQRECLSFCLWETREQAIEAVGAASHQAAAEISVLMYESYVLERYWLKKVVSARGERLIFESIQPG